MVELTEQRDAAIAITSPEGAVAGGNPSPAGRILLIKFGAIGDVVMAIPAAAARCAAGYAIDWVCSEAVAPVLRLYPWIHVLPVDEPKLLRGTRRERIAGVLGLWATLRKRAKTCGAYDLIATFYYDRRYRLLSLPVRARHKISLSRTERRFMLLPGRHHTDEYDRILSDRPDGERPFQLAPIRVPSLPALPATLQSSRPRVVLVPAGARNVLRDDALRRWPVEHYVALATDLVRNGFEVVLVGGPDDLWASESFGRLQAEGGVVDLIGKLSLVETLAVLDAAAVTVVHDTGPLHLAGITGAAIVTLFGPTDPHGRLPQRENAVAIWGGAGFACRPCYDGRDYAPCQHNGCMTQIAPGMVLREVLALAKARQEGRTLPPRVITPEPNEAVRIASGRTV